MMQLKTAQLFEDICMFSDSYCVTVFKFLFGFFHLVFAHYLVFILLFCVGNFSDNLTTNEKEQHQISSL